MMKIIAFNRKREKSLQLGKTSEKLLSLSEDLVPEQLHPEELCQRCK